MKQELQTKINEYRKSRDKVAMAALQAVMSAIQTLESTRNKDLNEPQILDIIEDEQKKYIESAEAFRGKDDDQAKECDYAAELLGAYLPEAIEDVPESKYEAIADSVIGEVDASSMREMGAVMEKIKAKYRDAIDAKVMSGIVKNKLMNFNG